MKRAIIIGVVLPLAILLVPIGGYFVFTDGNGQPVCHKAVDVVFNNWHKNNPSEDFPNVEGDSSKSLGATRDYTASLRLSEKYMYVPGLKRDDPGELILMYLSQPTRWRWHGGLRPSIFEEKRWLIIPVDMTQGRKVPGPRELSEALSTEEFKRRLRATLKFLEEQKRPNCNHAVAQHTEVLKRIEAGNVE